MVVESVKDEALQPDQLKARGVRAIITDLDNTLVPWRHYEISPGVVEWLAKLEVAGIKICIASNTIHTERLKQLADTMNIPFVDRVRKPGTGGFWRSMQKMESQRAETAVFGDQIFTDMLAGNRHAPDDHPTATAIVPGGVHLHPVRALHSRISSSGALRRARPMAHRRGRIEAALEAMPDPRRL